MTLDVVARCPQLFPTMPNHRNISDKIFYDYLKSRERLSDAIVFSIGYVNGHFMGKKRRKKGTEEERKREKEREKDLFTPYPAHS